MTDFFAQISDSLQITVQRELFKKILQNQNDTIMETLNLVVEKKSMHNLTRQKSLSLTQMSSSKFALERKEVFLPRIVESLDIYLNVPDKHVVKQGDGEQNFGERYDIDINLYFI